MAALLIICVIFILASLILLYIRFRHAYVERMNRVPGPNGHPFFGVMYESLYTPENKRMEVFDDYFKKHGPLFRTWVGSKCIIHVADAEHAQIILSSTAHINKSKIYSLFKPWLGSGMFVSGGKRWAQRRKLFTPAFHFSLLKDNIKVMVRHGQTLMGRLEKMADEPSFDIYAYFAESSLDIIGETALGVRLNVQNGALPEFMINIQKFTKLLADRIQKPFLEWDVIYRFTNNYKEQKKSIDILRKISTQIIKERIEERKEVQIVSTITENDSEGTLRKKIFLDAMLDAYEEGDKGVTLADIREELDGFIFAAYDSTSTSLAWTCYLVGCHPEIQAQIHAEIDAVLGADGEPQNMETISQLTYLERVFKESLRLYPPAPIVARNLGHSIRLGDHEIPAGTNVLIHMHLIQRSPKYFSSPNQFDPLREYINPNSFLPFISGPRNCIGQKFAAIEAMIILSMFFQRYKIQSLTKIEDMTTVWNLIWRSENGIRVKIRRRK